MFTFMTHFGESKLWQQQNCFVIDFVVTVSSRAVRISRRAVRVFPALSLRRVPPSYGTFSLMVFQGKCARGRKGHMIKQLIIFIQQKYLFNFNKNIYSTLTKIISFNKNIYSTSTNKNFIQQQSSRTFKISSFNKIPRPSPVKYKTTLSHASNISKACQIHN